MRWTKRSGGALLAMGAGLGGCHQEDCLDGDPNCVMVSPCQALEYTCDDGFTEAYVVGPNDPLPKGVTALGSDGDFVLANDQIRVVIEALEHPHYIAPSGGEIIDMVRRDTDQDALRHLFQAAGLLPGEAAVYTSARIIEDGPNRAVQVIGALDGHPDNIIATRYEVRPCEPGVRIRTELINGGSDPESWFLLDGFYLGGRESLPFMPSPGMGFIYPSFGLSTVADVVRQVPYLAIGGHPGPAASYSTVECDDDHTAGFVSKEISAVGVGPEILMPRDWRVYERFVTVADGASVSGAVDLALEARRQLFGEEWATIRGTIVAPVGPSMVPTGLRADLIVSAGSTDDALADRVPVTHTRPADDGTFEVRVPADGDYVIEVDAYGRDVEELDVNVGSGEADVGTITLPAVGELTIAATVDGLPDQLLVFLVPSDDATREATKGKTLGNFEECAPLLGHPHGDSPACNRLLVSGPTTVSVPPGTYDLLASAGPFSSLARLTDVEVVAGEGQSVQLDVVRLPIQPAGTLSGDFHVHGGPSFDSGINDRDRVRAFLASGIQVIATTEHDVVWDYEDAIQALGATDRLRLMTGTESTGHILFNFIPADPNPAVVGHWNFWPLDFDPRAPYRGAAWDEKAQPGLLMQRMRDSAGWDPETGVVELNHPLSGLQLGRAFGWADSLNIDGNLPLKTEFDGTGQSIFLATPPDDNGGTADFSNNDYDVQEIMNGTLNWDFLKYRDFWFYLLNQGIFHAGTGNSDCHTLTENVLGVPRTIVWTDATFAGFDPTVFDADVKAGHSIATNGPIIEISTLDSAGATRTPSMDIFEPQSGASLHINVKAAPWMVIDEVRIFVNGEQVQTIPVTDPADPMSLLPIDFERIDTTVPLADLLPASGDDAWIVVEAGPPHRLSADLDCDAFPDTSDNNDDGVVDWRDVEDLTEDPEESCLETVGPLLPREVPTDRDDPLNWFGNVFPGGYPLAITNPLILDVDGGGFVGVLR